MNLPQQPTLELEKSIPRSPSPRNFMDPLFNHRKEFETIFSPLFPEPQEESKVEKARAVLGEVVKDLPDEELANYLTLFQYLMEGWLDQYEKELFNGLTLQELLRERR